LLPCRGNLRRYNIHASNILFEAQGTKLFSFIFFGTYVTAVCTLFSYDSLN
jgi:hypothetical protein